MTALPTTLPTTKIDFPAAASSGSSRVLAVHELDAETIGVVTEATPFHPVDHTWPDQPGDTGKLRGLPVFDTVTAASSQGRLLVGEDIPVKRGDPEWSWHVLHLLRTSELGDAAAPEVGSVVELEVDVERRDALSAGHTGCHLVAFALNAALADRWRKEVRTDALGNPDFDSLAMVRSRILEHGSVDEYRMGKSLRKKGFTGDALADALPAITETVNGRLAEWLTGAAPVTVRTDGELLTDPRLWECSLPEGIASVPCGGTHLDSLGRLRSLTVELVLDEEGTGLTVRSAAELR